MLRKFTLALLSLLLVPLGMMAQSVTVDPSTGKLIAAFTYDGEVGFENGWCAMWKHEQLGLAFTVADDDLLSEGGDISNPADNINTSVDGNNLVVMGGVERDLYCVLSLPKGYSFTGYKMVLLNNLNGQTVKQMHIGYTSNTSTTYVSVDKVMYETDANFDISNYKVKTATMSGALDASTTTEYTLEREVTESTNLLYFRLNRGNDAFYGVTIKEFTVYFTAEGHFDTQVAPQQVGLGASYVTAPFYASKTDIGVVTAKEKNNKTYYSYDYKNVMDVDANIHIYRSDAVANGIASTDAGEKTIYPVKVDGEYQYAFGNGTYYVETPTQVTGQTGVIYPIGYRITGAKFDYKKGKQTSAGEKPIKACYITYTRNSQTYYLNDQLQFQAGQPFAWEIDDLGNITTSGGKRMLSCYGSLDERDLSFSTKKDSKYNLKRDSQGRIYYQSSTSYYYLQYYTSLGYYSTSNDGTEYYSWGASVNYWNEVTGIYGQYVPKVVKSTNAYNSNAGVYSWSDLYETNPYDYDYYRITGCYLSGYLATSTIDKSAKIPYAGYTPATAGTITIYKQTGVNSEGNYTESTETITVNGTAASKSLTGLNNDAVKFTVSGLPTGTQALVNVTLTMESLDPYIDKMNIVGRSGQLEMSQEFTAENFMVSGGDFVFHIPQDYSQNDITFSFEDLYSKYGDNTYYTDTDLEKDGNARYSFVSSDYFLDFDGKVGDGENDATTDAGLYDTRYKKAADSGTPPAGINYDYTTKVVATKAGDVVFKFNNAEELENTSGQTQNKYLEEYPFSVTAYTDPNGVTKGNFTQIKLNATNANGLSNSGTYYLFTADETRYNIAPTTAWQHRMYAFYRMGITLVAKSYTPVVTWTKIYDKTCYNKDNKDAFDSMWGAELATKDGNKPAKGYLSTKEINDAIEDNLDDTGNNGPKDFDQILYVDASELKSIVSSNTITMAQLQAKLAKNVLFYIPENQSSQLNNFAFKVGEGKFRAAQNIVITDRNPFFAKYEIQVPTANYASYTRDITWNADWDYTKYATIVLPYALTLVDGAHSEPAIDDEGHLYSPSKFTLSKMDAMSHDKAETDQMYDYRAKGFAHFTQITGNKSEAHKPYMVSITNLAGKNIPFTATEKGAKIEKTPAGGNFTGETLTGKIGKNNYTFTNEGGFSGIKLDAHNQENDENPGYFYYASGKFVNSKNLRKTKQYVFTYPFRSYYSYTKTGGAKDIEVLNITFDWDDISGIKDAIGNPDMVVKTGKGVIMVASGADNALRIYGMNGSAIAIDSLGAGEQRSYAVPSGVYVVNGVKVTVK